MGKTEACIKMLRYLNIGRTFKASELASLLETNVRNIVEYKNELEKAGYIIESISGRNGGYRLIKSELFPVVRLTDEEKKALLEGLNFIKKRKEFLNKTDYESAVAKVMSSVVHEVYGEEIVVINRFPLVMSERDLKERYDFFSECIEEKVEVGFKYISLKNREKEYVFQPYELFMFNNSWYVIGWLDAADRAAYFKLNRITFFEKTKNRFSIKKSYSRNDYLNEYGFKNNGEWYHVEFEAYNQYAMLVKERIYGRNQKVTPVDEKTTKVSVDMLNKENILGFILGFGKNAKVSEPQWLKESIKIVANGLIDQYE